ncbi:unnamed protein product [Laminaria digitata]
MFVLGWVLCSELVLVPLGPPQRGMRQAGELSTFGRVPREDCGAFSSFRSRLPGLQSRRFTCTMASRHNRLGNDLAASYSPSYLPDVLGPARGYRRGDRPRLRICASSRLKGNTWPERVGQAPSVASRLRLTPVCSVGDSNEGTYALVEGSAFLDDHVEELKTNDATFQSDFKADEATAAWSMSLKTRLHLTDQQVSSIGSSSPAVLDISAEELHAKIETLKTLLGGTESELGTIVAQQPHLLLADVDDRVREKVKWLSDIGLAPTDVRTVFATYPPFQRVDLDAMVGGISFLGDELDLSPQEIAKVIVGKPSILTSTKADDLQPRLCFYLDVLRMTKDEVKLMVVKDPTFLRLSVSNLNAKMLYFVEELGLRRLQLTKLMKEHSRMLGLSVDNKLRLNVAYLEHELGIPRNRLKRVIMALPSLLSYSVDDVLRPKVKWLAENLLLEEHQLRKMLTRHPQILSLSVNNNLVPKVSWLQKTFVVSDVALRGMITKNPSILLYNTENSIKPKVRFLTEEVGVADAQVLKIVIRSPILLSYSIESMRGKASFLKEGLQLNDADVSSLIGRSPQIMGYGTAAMESKVVFLMQALRASRAEACGLIFKYPQVLNLSVDNNLKKKMDYYRGELNGSPEDIRGAVLSSPTLLGYSLSKRLKPRVKVIRSVGVQPSFADHVWLVSSYTGLRFSKWVEKCLVQNIGADGRGDTEIRRRMKGYRAMLNGT